MISCAKTRQWRRQNSHRRATPANRDGAAIGAAVTVHGLCATIFCNAAEILRGQIEENTEENMIKRRGTKRRYFRVARALDRVADHARTSRAAGLPLAVPLPIPTYWTREQAIAFFKEHAPDVSLAEVDRYISWPAQALAYKMGQLKIMELRKQAEQKLGPKFDIREFHDVILRDGALPLELLDEQGQKYINSK